MVGTQLHSGVDAGDVGNALHLDEGSLVDHRDQDAVDDEAGSLVDLDRLLADGNGDLLDLLDSLSGSVAASDDLDELHAVCGVEEVHTDQRTADTLADLGDGQRRGVGSEDALGLADLIQLAESGLLDLHILESSLNDEVAVSAQVFLQARGDSSDDSVSLLLSHLALSDQLFIALLDLCQTILGPLLLDVTQSNRVALDLSKCLCDALAHSASTDNTDLHGKSLLYYIF